MKRLRKLNSCAGIRVSEAHAGRRVGHPGELRSGAHLRAALDRDDLQDARHPRFDLQVFELPLKVVVVRHIA